MRNQPRLDLASPRSDSPDIGQPASSFRVRILTTAVALVFFVVVCRIHILQQQSHAFIQPEDHLYQSRKPTPVRDGRILTADGLAVAYDRERFDLAIHYRWLEEPPNPEWLRTMTLRGLSKSERQLEDLVASREADVRLRRTQLWEDVRGRLGISAEEFKKRRLAIQHRVERISESVNRRHSSKESDVESNTATFNRPQSLSEVVDFVMSELTTPPRRAKNEDIIIQEELDYHTVFSGIPRDLAMEIESRPSQFPGTQIAVSHTRIYEHGTFLSSIVGLRKPFTADDARTPDDEPLELHPGVRSRGVNGVELSYDRQLRGIAGENEITRFRSGENVSTEIVRQPKPGRDVILTIDSRLQQELESIIDQKVTPLIPTTDVPADFNAKPTSIQGGCIVVIDVRSGEIVASASGPRPNLTLLADGDSEYWNLIKLDLRGPLMSRMTDLELPPGSIFKIVSSVAMLENDPGWMDRPFECQGYLDSPNRHRCYVFRHYGVGHGRVDLQRAIRESCNVYFFNAARELGPKPLIATAGRLGFGRPTGIDLPREKNGHLPTPGKGKWYPGDTLGLAIGQSSLLVTPLQIVRLMGIVANGGTSITPHLVRRNLPATHPDRSLHRVIPASYTNEAAASSHVDIPPEYVKHIQSAMKSVVEHSRGTGHKSVFHNAVTVAGKTGTAEVGGSKGDHAWFAGYTPADDPRYAFVVVLEHAGSGGREAGPVARQVVSQLLKNDLIQGDR